MSFQAHSEHPELLRAILDTVMYADIFDYPLTAAEIQRFLTRYKATSQSVEAGLKTALLSHMGEYYTLPERESIAFTRKKRALEASRLWPQARRYGKIIAGLPLVRMVAVTGSLAMNNTDSGGDIDFLIVTLPGGLWLCRLMVLAVVRLAAWFGISLCPNYLVTLNALTFPDQNLYTAHEFAQMVPLYGAEVYREIWDLNPWVREYFPNLDNQFESSPTAEDIKPAHGLKQLLEALLLTPAGSWLEQREMERKINRLGLENAGNSEASFSANVCKGHSNRHGWRTQTSYDHRLNRLASESNK